MIKFVFMDESGNKQDDRFFVCGFLEIQEPYEFTKNLQRVRDQIFDTVQTQRARRAEEYLQAGNTQELFALARKHSFFELKFGKITLHTLGLYNDLLRALNAKTRFGFKAIVIDRKHPDYEHESLIGMYRRITHLYFDHVQKDTCIFVPDQPDPSFDWTAIINRPDKVTGVLPATSHEFLPLQTVDVLTGIIRLGLEIHSGYKSTLGRNDTTKKQLIDTFESIYKIQIKPVSNSARNANNYIGIWTIDFAKTKKAKA